MLFALALASLLTGTPRPVQLPAGILTVTAETRVPAGFTLRGHRAGTTLRAASTFKGRAILVCESNVTVERLTIDGNRAALEKPVEIAPYDKPFIRFYNNNGIIADGVKALTLKDITLRNIANFAVIVAASDGVALERVHVSDSGSRKANGRNNTSGGILIEEGTKNFAVRLGRYRNIRGNGLWTHSLYTSPRNGPGVFQSNDFENIGRDALQAGHAMDMVIEKNTGRRIGWPVDIVDVEGGGTPVAIDTAGNVSDTLYAQNRFEEINGKCIDLDGFHSGRVLENSCVNRGKPEDYPFGHYGIVFNNTNPDMQSRGIVVEKNLIDGTKFGGIFVIGQHHTIMGNRLLNINMAGCNESHAKFGCVYDAKQPDLLRSGIYLGAGAERPDPAQLNVISENEISGYGMAEHCIAAAPGIEIGTQDIGKNECRNTPPRK